MPIIIQFSCFGIQFRILVEGFDRSVIQFIKCSTSIQINRHYVEASFLSFKLAPVIRIRIMFIQIRNVKGGRNATHVYSLKKEKQIIA